jgi:hypothetical protein
MPSRTEATRAKAALCATGRLTPLRLFSTLPFSSLRASNKTRAPDSAFYLLRPRSTSTAEIQPTERSSEIDLRAKTNVSPCWE